MRGDVERGELQGLPGLMVAHELDLSTLHEVNFRSVSVRMCRMS